VHVLPILIGDICAKLAQL